MKYISLSLAAFAAGVLAAPAFATDCNLNDITPAALACSGGYAKNVLDNNSGDIATQIAGLAAIGFTWDGSDFGSLAKLSSLPGGSGPTTIDFGELLHGTTYVGFHVGGKGGGENDLLQVRCRFVARRLHAQLARQLWGGSILDRAGHRTFGA